MTDGNDGNTNRVTFNEALCAEREGNYELAAQGYERLLSIRPEKSIYLNLIGIYFQAWDPGFAAGNHLSREFMDQAGKGLLRVLQEGMASFPDDPDIAFLNRYIRWKELGDPLSDAECAEALKDMESWPLPILRLPPEMAAAEQIEALEKWCGASGTELASYVLSVLQGCWRDETRFPRKRPRRG